MGQTAFYPDLNALCMAWSAPLSGNTTVYGGPVRSGSEEFRKQFRNQQASLFENLLIFDSVNLSINGPNVIAPLLYRSMGSRAFEGLIEQGALRFTVWTPGLMMSHKDDRVKSTFVGRVGDGTGSELDIEKIVDLGLEIQQVNMPDWYKRDIRKKLIDIHSLLDQKLPETAWQVAEHALERGELELIGLTPRSVILDSTFSDGAIFMGAAESILAFRYILQHGMSSLNSPGIFDIFDIGAKQLNSSKSPMAKYSIITEYEKFPNLRVLHSLLDQPFEQACRFRNSHTSKRFRDWISTTKNAESQIDIIREYVNECSRRRGLFESAPAKFMKLTGMVAIGHILTPAAHHIGEFAGALIASVPEEAINQISETGSEVGLGVIDSFLIDNLKVGWTPRAYFNRLRKLKRSGQRARLR